jgi:hypothetical protein
MSLRMWKVAAPSFSRGQISVARNSNEVATEFFQSELRVKMPSTRRSARKSVRQLSETSCMCRVVKRPPQMRCGIDSAISENGTPMRRGAFRSSRRNWNGSGRIYATSSPRRTV